VRSRCSPSRIAITHIPYVYIRRTTEEGLYCVGDQAAVIPSFTGDGESAGVRFPGATHRNVYVRSERAGHG
jgi:hypothetical protein